MRGFGHQHTAAAFVLAACRQRRADRHHAAQFAMRARLGRERDSGHAGQFLQPVREFMHQFERALHGLDRLQGMHIADAGQARHLLVQARIMLHGAGAERIEPRIDRIVLGGEAHIMAHDFGFREPRQADPALTLEIAEIGCERLRLVEIDAADARIIQFEQ